VNKSPPTPTKGAEQSEWDAYNETLENTDAYKAAMNEYGTGSNKQQAIQAITAAIQGLTGGDWSSAVAGAAAPYMAEFIKNNTAEGAERIISHALAGAIVAEMQGGNAAAGAAGAGLSAAGAKYIADQLYPGKDIKDLTEEEKQGVVALATLASGIAGGVVGGDVSSAIDGAKAGKSGSVTEQAAKSTRSLADHVKDNIALSEKARESSNFAIHSAKSDQLQWGYAADEWSMTTLPAGSKVYGGIPVQSAYYTTEQTLLNANFGRESLFQSLQVSPHPEFGYRPQMGVYEVTNPITIPSGTVWENPLLGPGGGTQFFIKDYNKNLKLIDKIDLGK
jgi:hypothetical protein